MLDGSATPASGVPVRTACPYCGVGCGVLATPRPDGTVAIEGDPDHPANFGQLCSKGSALGETLSLDGRLLYPEIDGRRATWDQALDLVAERFGAAIAEHGPGSVALYVSGQLLTEDYYVANKFMKGFVGTANIDTNSRLCMASSVAGHRRAFGSDTVPGCYEDLDEADLVVLVGSNLAWCHPILQRRLTAAREKRGTKVVVIDPRATDTSAAADLHLAIAPGADVALWNGLLAHLAETGAIDRDYVARHTSGFEDALAAAASLSLAAVAAATGLAAAEIAAFYRLFATTDRVVTAYSQGVNQSSAGTDKVNAILNCHLATGRIGRPGMGPLSLTGQPNAMGGRETGGLANMLAAHMDLADPAHRRIVQSFWSSPRIADTPGLKAVDMFRAVADGRIKAIWIMATNPLVSMPEADAVAAALAACPFVVVSDVVKRTDTAAAAHVLLPAAAWGEKDGTVTNSERRISRQRPFLPSPGESRPDWWHIAEVAKRLGWEQAFDYAGPSAIFAEYAALTTRDNGGSRDLDLGGIATLDQAAYDALAPVQWPVATAAASGSPVDPKRFFAAGGYFTPDRRARFVPLAFRPPVRMCDESYPLVLNTGRIRDQWHTMTRTAKSPRLNGHMPEPYVEIAPEDASLCGVVDGAIALVATSTGSGLYRVIINAGQRRGSVFVPMHWTGCLSSRSRVGPLVNAETDPVSGQPELKHTPVSVTPFAARWYGASLTLAEPRLEDADYAALVNLERGYRLELAGSADPADPDAFAAKLLGDTGELLSYRDAATGQLRFAMFDGERLTGALFLAREPLALARGWLAGLLGRPVAAHDRLRLLAGRPGGTVTDQGPIVCACFNVGRNEIENAIAAGHCATVAEVGQRVKAGTNCGSCRTEIARLLAAKPVRQTA